MWDSMRLLGEELLDGRSNGGRLGVGAVALNDVALLVDEELGEVPLCGALRRRGGRGQGR